MLLWVAISDRGEDRAAWNCSSLSCQLYFSSDWLKARSGLRCQKVRYAACGPFLGPLCEHNLHCMYGGVEPLAVKIPSTWTEDWPAGRLLYVSWPSAACSPEPNLNVWIYVCLYICSKGRLLERGMCPSFISANAGKRGWELVTGAGERGGSVLGTRFSSSLHWSWFHSYLKVS